MSKRDAPGSHRQVGRRDFLVRSATAAVGAAAAGLGDLTARAEDSAAESDARKTRRLPLRDFGKTGLKLPILAFGGSAMVEKWKATYGPQLSFAERVAMVRLAFEAGIRYFDTSPNYGESEAILGEALHDVRREVYLATKVGVTTDDKLLEPGDVRASLGGSLRRLRTDHVDCVQIHGPAFEYKGLQRAKELHGELAKLRGAKLFRYIGVTAHNAFEPMYRLIDTGLFDQALIAYGYFPKGMDTILSHANLHWRERCLNRARELGMGIVAMKVLGSFLFGYRAAEIAPQLTGPKLARLREAALRWASQDNRVTLLVIGMTRPTDIAQNVATLSADLSCSDADRKLLAEFSSEAFGSRIVQQMKTQ
jgi:aryl-alcohol dehydrogenase-like predicted oxidoreductase